MKYILLAELNNEQKSQKLWGYILMAQVYIYTSSMYVLWYTSKSDQ